MPIFRKRIYFPQFLADLISFQCDFLTGHFDRLIALADEFHVLQDADRKSIRDKTYELLLVDILMSSKRCFSGTLSSEAVNEAVSMVYAKYLTEYRHVPVVLAEQKLQNVLILYRLVYKAEESADTQHADCRDIGYTSFPKIHNPVEREQFYLCRAFAEYCAGEDMKTENWEGKHFAALKLARAVVRSDVVGHALKHYTVTF